MANFILDFDKQILLENGFFDEQGWALCFRCKYNQFLNYLSW